MRIAVCLLISLFKHLDNGAASMRNAVWLSIPLMNVLTIVPPQWGMQCAFLSFLWTPWQSCCLNEDCSVPFYFSDEHPDNCAASMRNAVCLSIPLMDTLTIVLPQWGMQCAFLFLCLNTLIMVLPQRGLQCAFLFLGKHPDNGATSMRIAVCLIVSLFKHPDNHAASKRIAVCLSIPLMNVLTIVLPQRG